MDITIYHNGNDITNKVLSYSWSKEVCSSKGLLDIQLYMDHGLTLDHYDEIVIYEGSTKKGTFTITSFGKDAPGGKAHIYALDDSRKLDEYFISENFLVDYPSTNLYWIERFFAEAQITYVIDSNAETSLLNNDTSLGMDNLGSAIIPLLQLSGLYLYFDADNVAHIGKLDLDTSSVDLSVDDSVIKNIVTTGHDKMFRNRAVVWGKSDPLTNTWVYVDLNTSGSHENEYGPNDVRAVVVSNSHIRTLADARTMGIKLLRELEKADFEVTLELIGSFDLHLGDRVEVNSDWLSFTGTVTTIGSSVSEEGLTTLVILNKRCPRIFGHFDFGGEVFVGTKGAGIWRKHLKYNHTWYDFSSGLGNLNIFDLAIAHGNFATIAHDGLGYVRSYSSAGWTPISYGNFTNVSGEIPTYSTVSLASGVPSGMIDSNGVYAAGCAVSRYDGQIYFTFNSFIPDYENGYTFYSSGWDSPSGMSDFESRSFILEATANGNVKNAYQVITTYDNKEVYNLTNINLQADGEGVTGVYKIGDYIDSRAIRAVTYRKGERFEWITSNELSTYTKYYSRYCKTTNPVSYGAFTEGSKTYIAYADRDIDNNQIAIVDWTTESIVEGVPEATLIPIPDQLYGVDTVYHSDGIILNVYLDKCYGQYFGTAIQPPAKDLIIIFLYSQSSASTNYKPYMIFYDMEEDLFGSVTIGSAFVPPDVTSIPIPSLFRPTLIHGHTAVFETYLAYLKFPQKYFQFNSSNAKIYQGFNNVLHGIHIEYAIEPSPTDPDKYSLYKLYVDTNTFNLETGTGLTQSVNFLLYAGTKATVIDENLSKYGTYPSFSRESEEVYFRLGGDYIYNPLPSNTVYEFMLDRSGALLVGSLFGIPPFGPHEIGHAPVLSNNENTNYGLVSAGYEILGEGTPYRIAKTDFSSDVYGPEFFTTPVAGTYSLRSRVGYTNAVDYVDDSFYSVEYYADGGNYNTRIRRTPLADYSAVATNIELPTWFSTKPTLAIPHFQENVICVKSGVLGSSVLTFFRFGDDIPEPEDGYLLINTQKGVSTVIEKFDIPYKVENDFDTYNLVWNRWNSWIFPNYAYYPLESGYSAYLLPTVSGENPTDIRYAEFYDESSFNGTTVLLPHSGALMGYVVPESGTYSTFSEFNGPVTHVETTNMDMVPYVFTTTEEDRYRFYQKDSVEDGNIVDSAFADRTGNLPDYEPTVIRCDDEV